mmetsp:Transcript_13533/g.19683  ORF Transcript_13533/g.19683 Transcript_13533/m.19683 type:complete len:216 (+) Transcript_13533:53-700(+)
MALGILSSYQCTPEETHQGQHVAQGSHVRTCVHYDRCNRTSHRDRLLHHHLGCLPLLRLVLLLLLLLHPSHGMPERKTRQTALYNDHCDATSHRHLRFHRLASLPLLLPLLALLLLLHPFHQTHQTKTLMRVKHQKALLLIFALCAHLQKHIAHDHRHHYRDRVLEGAQILIGHIEGCVVCVEATGGGVLVPVECCLSPPHSFPLSPSPSPSQTP